MTTLVAQYNRHIYSLTIIEAISLKLSCEENRAPSGDSRKKPFLSSSSFFGVSLVWPHYSNICLPGHIASPSPGGASPSDALVYTLVIGLRAPQINQDDLPNSRFLT